MKKLLFKSEDSNVTNYPVESYTVRTIRGCQQRLNDIITKFDDVGSNKNEMIIKENTKSFLYVLIVETKKLIKERFDEVNMNGSSSKAIRLKVAINMNIRSMCEQYQTLVEIFDESNSKNSTDSLLNRPQELDYLKEQIEECVDLCKSEMSYPEEKVKTLTDFISQMEETGIEPPKIFSTPTGKWREPSQKEKDTIKRWKERDKLIDADLLELGKNIDTLNDITLEIGDKAKKQHIIAIELGRQAEEVNREIYEINEQIKSFVSQGSSFNFCIKFLMTIFVIILCSLALKNIISLIKKSLHPSSNSKTSRSYLLHQNSSDFVRSRDVIHRSSYFRKYLLD